MSSGKQIAENINVIVANAKAGEGAVGQLLTDRKLYDEAVEFAEAAADTTKNLRETSKNVERLLSELRESRIVPEAEQTVVNLQELTRRVKEAVEKLSADEEGTGMVDELRVTVADARETALKPSSGTSSCAASSNAAASTIWTL